MATALLVSVSTGQQWQPFLSVWRGVTVPALLVSLQQVNSCSQPARPSLSRSSTAQPSQKQQQRRANVHRTYNII